MNTLQIDSLRDMPPVLAPEQFTTSWTGPMWSLFAWRSKLMIVSTVWPTISVQPRRTLTNRAREFSEEMETHLSRFHGRDPNRLRRGNRQITIPFTKLLRRSISYAQSTGMHTGEPVRDPR